MSLTDWRYWSGYFWGSAFTAMLFASGILKPDWLTVAGFIATLTALVVAVVAVRYFVTTRWG